MKALLLALVMMAFPALADVQDVRVWQSPDKTRLVFDLSAPHEHKIFTLTGPDRVVIDINNARVNSDLAGLDTQSTSIRSIRSARRNQNDVRIVIDVTEPVSASSFPLAPNDVYKNNRLVVDLERLQKTQVIAPVKKADSYDDNKRDVIIAIDAGHGGEDPGAIGHGRTKEKYVVLAIAKELQRLLDAETGFTPFMVRTGDYYIGLRERTDKARKANADFFVSIHADAFKVPSASGSSVFVLSERGATSEAARWLADKENESDLVGGVSLEDKEDHLAMTLLDLSMTHKRNSSVQLGNNILEQVGKVSKLHKDHVEEAAFVVLKAPDIPALLVETGFISNPQESRKLADPAYQKKMAKAIFTGVTEYFRSHPPRGTLLAAERDNAPVVNTYVIQRGDTLSDIALKNGVAINDLRRLNDLKNDQLRVGQSLKIPNS
ncbi:N-acetylmuramoyl-L-alanine amidase [Thalassolituus sp. LLYu03]|uniref:N-acetylmuramoyl-L-alanine amidase n=1 Tax=Thalassolituus sp. LLYu03 TaxID=3421656 RepID=UPI003D28CCA3